MHDVISAFLDNEPFEAQELSEALATQEGRDLLLDLIALRNVVEPVQVATEARKPATRGRSRWMLASAAAVLLALVSGYQFGRTTDSESAFAPGGTISAAAPEPTTVLKFEPGVNWDESPRNGGK